MSVSCKRCGCCCRADMVAYASAADIARWAAGKRTDILAVIEDMKHQWAGDIIIDENGQELLVCSFLRYNADGTYCAIYDTRPAVCENFLPGSSALCPLSRP